LNLILNTAPVAGDVISVIQAGSISGTFSNGPLISAAYLSTTYNFAISYTTTTVVLTALRPVKTWTGANSSYWNNAGNWLQNAVPVSNDSIVFDNHSNSNLATSNDISSGLSNNLDYR